MAVQGDVMTERRTWIALLLLSLVALGVAACGGGGESETQGAPDVDGIGVPGTTVYTVGRDLIIETDGAVRPLLVADGTVTYLSPTLSPDGSEVAYVLFDQQVGLEADISSDLHVISLAGTDRLEGEDRTILEHQERAEFFWTPRWSADGRSLVYAHQTRTDDDFGAIFTLEILDLETGTTRALREQARGGDSSPSEPLVAFVDSPQIDSRLATIHPTTLQVSILLTVANGLSGYRVPQFSPDGEWIAFLATGDGPSVSDGVVAALGTGRNGVQDVWMIRPDGSGLQRLTTVLEDQPDFAWSSDGRHILLRGAFGVYTVEVGTRSTLTLGPGEFHGWHDWRGTIVAADPES
jgi:Tol biopolymer transport system component